MLGFLAGLAFFVADVASLVVLGRVAGGWWVVGAVLGGFVASVLTFRFLGPLTAFRVAGRLANGELPGRELVDALLMAVGGLLFATPGLLSDAAALVLILPGFRALPRALVVRWVKRRAVVVHAGAAPPPEDREPARGDTIDADYWERR